MENTVIRKMTKKDWNRVSEIYAYAVKEGKSTFTRVCPSCEQWNKAHIEQCRFVSVTDSRVSGWCAVSHVSSVEAYRGVVEVSIYIDSAYRNRGIGTLLLNRLIEESEKEGFWTLYVSIFSENKASIRLHEKSGFKVVGRRERIARDIFDNWLDTIIMERRSDKI